MSAPGEFPTIREELERKVTEEVERLVLAVQQGKMSPYGYQMALDGLWGGVAGIVSKESMELISAARQSFQGTHAMSRVFRRATAVVKVTWVFGEASFSIKGMAPDAVIRHAADGMASTTMREFSAFAAGLLKQGWEAV
ncbi:hypothetical protein [Burkholderia vietnamiensis]|uniref:hypothetical protein n=1 Tax=Burkholderia vietnamiensis TaxID=60552 RepID=UPI001CAAA32C|nr:hypothetical protein [Burkholderia vietnamiensis]CAG9229259.1 hypothetical protein BVI1335_70179 [Burkholderia vietnamiensis]HDR9086294.1 hypothetical protein [Burkholderia vietnamiensis]